MTKAKRKVDPLMRHSFNEYCESLPLPDPTTLEQPLRSIKEIKERFCISDEELSAWRRLAFPLYRVKGRNDKERFYANPERIMAWFRWRDAVQNGLVVIDPTALNR